MLFTSGKLGVAMAERSCETIDPRIRRTRQLLQQALEKLLETKKFDGISVQEIADAATVNRATFYDHYTDKFALLDCMVARRFYELLVEREVQFDGTCTMALKAIVMAACDYLTGMQGRLEPRMESAIITVVRGVLLDGLKRHPQENGAIAPEMMAATASWAIYGAAKEWSQAADRCGSEKISDTVAMLVSPILGLRQADAPREVDQ